MQKNRSSSEIILLKNSMESNGCFRIKPVNIDLGELTQHNLKQLKILHRDIFPVSYNEKFYKDLLDAGELCKLGSIENVT